ncbi:MAG: hypothetical protein H0X26_07620 [Alphaproteobacteria bacterium]|nr:hypothetical protein [Alphaproteobacteria bacterium]
MQNIASLEQQSDNHKALPKFLKILTGKSSTSDVKLVFSKKDVSPPYYQEEAPNHDTLLQDDYTRATSCISQIIDPLWKNICADLLHIMGPASILKIWKSELGEFSSSDKHIDITCETEETAAFVQQYDFVILGSLQRYFSGLKQLRAKDISVL